MIILKLTINDTFTITDTTTNTTYIIKQDDCMIHVFDNQNYNFHVITVERTCVVKNKYTNSILVYLNSAILDPSSDGYSSDMDVYASYLKTLI